MKIALFFITHEGIASNLLHIAEAILQQPNKNIEFFEVPMDASSTQACNDIEAQIAKLEIENGILFITDIFGSTPSNIAQTVAKKHDAYVVSGVNLPMVIRLLNYRNEPEVELLQKALDGAHHGIQLKKAS